MTSWNCTARLFLFVFLSKIQVSNGACMDLFDVTKWRDNLTQVFPVVDTSNPEDIAECTWEREYIETKNNAAWYILRDCFGRERTDESESGKISDKCKWDTSGTIPYYYLMCATIKALKNKAVPKLNTEALEIIAKYCEYDFGCKTPSVEPSTATPTTLPERTVVTPTTTTTELPPTATNFTQINGLNQSTTLPQAKPEKTTSAIRPKVTPTLPPPSSPPPTTTSSTTTDLVNATPTTLPERTVVTATTTTTELPPTTTNFTQINALNRSTTLPLTTTQPEETTSGTRLVPPTVTTTEISPHNGKLLAKEKENVTLKVMLVISATLNSAALMMILYRCKRNPGSSHEPVGTYMSDGASLEAQPMTELKSCTVGPFVNRRTVESTHLMESPEPDSTSTHSPNGCRVGNEE